MGVVYAAHDVALQRDVAVKLVRPDIEPSRARRRSERLRVEAQLLAKPRTPTSSWSTTWACSAIRSSSRCSGSVAARCARGSIATKARR